MFEHHLQRRVDLTTSCRDADSLPKVDGAGEVSERDGVRVQTMHNGVIVVEGCYYGAWMTEVIRRLGGHHEPQEEVAFHAVVQRLRRDPPEAPTIVELGSFWAYYALWFHRALPGARLVLVEPDPAHLEVGRRNVELNGATARHVQAAVGTAGGSAARIACESDGVHREIAVVSVDGLIAREGLDRVDVLLCDTQGAELDMLDGAGGALAAGRIRFLVVSTHHHSISGDPLTHQRCLARLHEVGAQIVVEHTVSESYSGDGLIVAAMDRRDRDLRVDVSRARARDSLFGELEHDLADAIAQRDAALGERDAARARGDAARAERDAALGERDAARARGNAARAERDAARAECDAARAERDAARAERDDAPTPAPGSAGPSLLGRLRGRSDRSNA